MAMRLGVGRAGLESAVRAVGLNQGGNQWGASDAPMAFFRHVAGLPIDYTAWASWEDLAIHSGPRFVHAKFCIISDRPERLLVDAQNRPHCEDGPFCRWRDGTALYAVHGARVPWYVVEQPEQITIEAIRSEDNTEVQRVMIERFGWDRYARECGDEIIDHDEAFGTLYGRNGAATFVRVVNGSPEPDGSFRQYVLPVLPACEPIPDPDDLDASPGAPQALSALNAVASTYGMTGEEYRYLRGRT